MKRLLLTTTALLGLTSPALAESADSTRVDEIIVTATRLESRIGEAPGVRVISRQDIDAGQATFAGDILETIQGISLSRNGDFGGVTYVRMRGASADKTLVLIDGVVQNDPSSPNGGFDFSSLDLGEVERIEVLSGPQGSLWGSDAIGGAIAFTTRELDGWRASAEGGSFGTVRGTAAFGVSDDRRAFGLSAAAYFSDGVSKAANGTEDDGFESWTVAANGRLTLSDTVRIDGRLRYNEAEADLDGYDAFFTFGDTADRSESRSWTGFARITADELLGFNQVFDVSVYDLTRDNISAFASSYDARRTTWRWTAGRGGAGNDFAFLVGVERDDTEASISTGATSDLGATSAFLAREGDSWLLQAVLLLDVDIQAMLEALKVPTEKLSADGLADARERLITARQCLGEVPPAQSILSAMSRGIAAVMDIHADLTHIQSGPEIDVDFAAAQAFTRRIDWGGIALSGSGIFGTPDYAGTISAMKARSSKAAK